jgi:hypothetical protein
MGHKCYSQVGSGGKHPWEGLLRQVRRRPAADAYTASNAPVSRPGRYF